MNKYLEKIAKSLQKRDLAMVFAKYEDGWAASTRPLDKAAFPGEIGTPGGKGDPGETPRQIAIREAMEEGWDLEGLHEEPFHVHEGDTFRIHSFFAEKGIPRKEWKESHRGVKPVKATLKQLAETHETNAVPARKLLSKGHS